MGEKTLIERLREMSAYPRTHFHYLDDAMAVQQAADLWTPSPRRRPMTERATLENTSLLDILISEARHRKLSAAETREHAINFEVARGKMSWMDVEERLSERFGWEPSVFDRINAALTEKTNG